MKDLHLHQITDSTRNKAQGILSIDPQRKSRALKPVLQTPVFISDARKDTVIRDKSMKLLSACTGKTIQSEKVQPPDFCPFWSMFPSKNSNRHIFVGPIFNAFLLEYTRGSIASPLWHTSKTQKTALSRSMRNIIKQNAVQQVFSSPPQIENIQIKSGDKVYVAHLGGFNAMTRFK